MRKNTRHAHADYSDPAPARADVAGNGSGIDSPSVKLRLEAATRVENIGQRSASQVSKPNLTKTLLSKARAFTLAAEEPPPPTHPKVYVVAFVDARVRLSGARAAVIPGGKHVLTGAASLARKELSEAAVRVAACEHLALKLP